MLRHAVVEKTKWLQDELCQSYFGNPEPRPWKSQEQKQTKPVPAFICLGTITIQNLDFEMSSRNPKGCRKQRYQHPNQSPWSHSSSVIFDPILVDVFWKLNAIAFTVLFPFEHRLIPFPRRYQALLDCGFESPLASFDRDKWPFHLFNVSAFALDANLKALRIPFGYTLDIDLLDAAKRCQTL